MSKEQTNTPNDQPASAKHEQVSPDALMNDFKGKPIARIVIFTVIIHAIFIGLFSFGYIRNEVMGEDTAELTEDERMDLAVKESTTALRDIADRYDINVRDLSKAFVEGKGPAGDDKAPAMFP